MTALSNSRRLVQEGALSAFLVPFLAGLMLGALDMGSLGTATSRLAEPIIIGLLFYRSRFEKPLWAYSALLILTAALCVTLVSAGVPQQIIWIGKLSMVMLLSFTALNQRSADVIHVGIGVMAGYLLIAVMLIGRGEAYEAKYAAPQSAIFVVFLLSTHCAFKRLVAGLLCVIGLGVAILSASRGQLALLAALLLLLAFGRRFYRSPKLKSGLLLLCFTMPFAYLALALLMVARISTLSPAELGNLNAGDLERSILSLYALTALSSAPLGQSVSAIDANVSSVLSALTLNELKTTSAHNIVGDCILYAGVPGLLFLLAFGVRLYARLRAIIAPFPPDFWIAAVSAVAVGVFVLSSAPLAGLERMELLICLAIVGRLKARRASSVPIH